jgi:ATP-dependent Lon protease
VVPCLAVRSAVVFPRAVATLDIVRAENLAALAAHPDGDASVVAVPLREFTDAPALPEQVHSVGTLSRLLDRLRLPDGSQRIVLQGLTRVSLVELSVERGYLHAGIEAEPPCVVGNGALEELVTHAMELVGELVDLDPRYSGELPKLLVLNRDEPGAFMDLLASRLHLAYADATRLLTELDLGKRLQLSIEELAREVARARAARSLQDKVQERARRGWLREQLAVIQTELGEGDPLELERRELAALIESSSLPSAANRRLMRELAYLSRAAPGSAEAGRLRGWIEWVLELPWNKRSEQTEPPDFERVMAALDSSHTGLTDVKNRITEFLAVQRLGGAARGTVLCFHGPPGTGKTSMARAVAQALGREFVHVPVGAVTDEAELCGRHRTHPGSTPGRILTGLHRAGTKNPVVLIDEIDKIQLGGSAEAGGALLEILDPEQNQTFLDHYLGVPFDLSECIFLATANDTRVLGEALIDRLELIPFESYTEGEKLSIAREHLVERARAAAGLERAQFELSRGALLEVLRNYTEEAGVRQLARTLESLARKAAIEVVRGRAALRVHKSDLLDLLGPANVDEELHLCEPRVGVANGLAWTAAGGSMLPIEALAMPGQGRSILTGSVGEVMRESVQTATSWVRARLAVMGLRPDALESLDIHLHFPSGATPKDGPSAGLAIVVALVSLLSGVPVRHDVAMTGEIALHGAVLAVGGLREKLLAALRAGVRVAVVPARNSEEILRLPPEVRQRLDIRVVDDVRTALRLALASERGGAFRKALEGEDGERPTARSTRAQRRKSASRRRAGPGRRRGSASA